MEIPFVLTRANYVDICEGILLFEDDEHYKVWMKTNCDRFRICSNVQTKVLTLLNF